MTECCCICLDENSPIFKRCYQCVEGLLCEKCYTKFKEKKKREYDSDDDYYEDSDDDYYENEYDCPICRCKDWKVVYNYVMDRLSSNNLTDIASHDGMYKKAFRVFNRNRFDWESYFSRNVVQLLKTSFLGERYGCKYVKAFNVFNKYFLFQLLGNPLYKGDNDNEIIFNDMKFTFIKV